MIHRNLTSGVLFTNVCLRKEWIIINSKQYFCIYLKEIHILILFLSFTNKCLLFLLYILTLKIERFLNIVNYDHFCSYFYIIYVPSPYSSVLLFFVLFADITYCVVYKIFFYVFIQTKVYFRAYGGIKTNITLVELFLLSLLPNYFQNYFLYFC